MEDADAALAWERGSSEDRGTLTGATKDICATAWLTGGGGQARDQAPGCSIWKVSEERGLCSETTQGQH